MVLRIPCLKVKVWKWRIWCWQQCLDGVPCMKSESVNVKVWKWRIWWMVLRVPCLKVKVWKWKCDNESVKVLGLCCVSPACLENCQPTIWKYHFKSENRENIQQVPRWWKDKNSPGTTESWEEQRLGGEALGCWEPERRRQPRKEYFRIESNILEYFRIF